MWDARDSDLFYRRLIFAFHGHPPGAEDDRLHCAACGIDFGTASMAEMMQATRRAAIAEATRRAAETCPRCRRLERMLLLATAYLSAANWYESPETLHLLDRVKAHLRKRYRDMLNRYLPPSVD